MAESAREGPTLQLLFTEGWEAQKKVETGSLSAEERKVLIKTILKSVVTLDLNTCTVLCFRRYCIT